VKRTHNGQQSDSAANVEQQWYDAELASLACHFDDEANAERFDEITVQLTVLHVCRRISIATAAAATYTHALF